MSDLSSNSQGADIAKSNVPLHVKFALICLNKIVIPKWLGTFCFTLSHIQALALIIKSVYLALPDNTPSSSPAILLFVNPLSAEKNYWEMVLKFYFLEEKLVFLNGGSQNDFFSRWCRFGLNEN